MAGYRLSPTALREVSAIVSGLHSHVSPDFANEMERQLLSAFALIGRFPDIGHTRNDLTSKPLLFFTSKPYIIAFRRQRDQVMIYRVMHGSRNLPKFF
jgi:plasmid stabilization system protein ParE